MDEGSGERETPPAPGKGCRPGRRGAGAPVGGSPRAAGRRGLRTRRERRGWPAPRCSGGRASARGCHGDGLAGGGGYAEKRSALSLAAAPGSPRQRWVRSCRPAGGPGHGVRRPEPLGLRAGLGTARRRPALTAAPCPAPGGAEAARILLSAFRMLIKEYHILLPMSLDEYQVAQLYMILVRAVGSGRPRGPYSMQERAGRTWDRGLGLSPTGPAPGLERAEARGGERGPPSAAGGDRKGCGGRGRRA